MSLLSHDKHAKKMMIFLFCAIYAAFGLLLYSVGIQILFMVWNIFLAVLPLIFAMLAEKSKNRAICFAAVLLWLLFFPNAPYMITDLIHVPPIENYHGGNMTSVLKSWIKLIYIGSGVIWGNITGLMSLEKIHGMAVKAYGKAKAGFALAALFLLSGCAIYLGRYLRLNSWDITRPLYLLTRITKSFSSFSAAYSLLSAAYTAFSYAIYRAFLAGRD